MSLFAGGLPLSPSLYPILILCPKGPQAPGCPISPTAWVWGYGKRCRVHCHVSLGLVARAGFVVKQLENACGAPLEVTKRWPLGCARTGQRASCHHLTFLQRRKVSQMSSRGQFKHLILCRLTFLLMDVNCAVHQPSLVFLECSR